MTAQQQCTNVSRSTKGEIEYHLHIKQTFFHYCASVIYEWGKEQKKKKGVQLINTGP